MHLMNHSRALFAALIAACPMTAATAVAQGAPPLASHRAVYELTLDKSTGSKAPAQARGRIVFEFNATCEGYVQNFRQMTELQPAEGATKLSDMISATFEALDASDMRFRVETKVDNRLSEATDGKARKEKDAKIAVDLVKPRRAHLTLDGPAFFPSEHLLHIIDAARAGEQLLEARVYDGTGQGDKTFDTLTVIGKAIETPAPEKVAAPLAGMKRWRVAVSYFETGKRDGQPIYVLSFDTYENGISRALSLDYGDFVLKGEMKELAVQHATVCKK